MTIVEFKRINVITDFENKIDRKILNENNDIILRCANGKICYVFEVKEELFESEKKYIVEHLNRRKSFITMFITLDKMLKPGQGFKYTKVLNTAHELIVKKGKQTKNSVYFVVFKNQY